MKYNGVLVNHSFSKINVFDEHDPGIRDDCLSYLRIIYKILLENNIGLLQQEIKSEYKSTDFTIELEVQDKNEIQASLKYLIRFECKFIRPMSYKKEMLSKYSKVFSWNDEGVEPQQFVSTMIPNTFIEPQFAGWSSRAKTCCMIAGNKFVSSYTELELYSERIKTIRWFEQNAPTDFDLYGTGWDTIAAKKGLLNRIVRKLNRVLPGYMNKIYFPLYRGPVVRKIDVLSKYRFSICYENIRDCPNYITEKIWDSFFAGCIPIYWGASNIMSHVPANCFIDRRSFSDHNELYKFMRNMTESDYEDYQKRIVELLKSKAAQAFSAQTFADNVVKSIIGDLKGAK